MKDQYKEAETAGEDQSRADQKKEYRRRETRGWILSLLIAVVIALCIRFFVFEFIRVDGPSMEKTLYTDEYVFMEKVTYWFRHPEYGDIVICLFPDSTDSYVKRVIGTPGDKIKILDGVLYINGNANTEDYGNDETIKREMAEITVPEGCVFVMGDHRNESRDSRDPGVGPISYGKILGKAEFIIWPLNKINGL